MFFSFVKVCLISVFLLSVNSCGSHSNLEAADKLVVNKISPTPAVTPKVKVSEFLQDSLKDDKSYPAIMLGGRDGVEKILKIWLKEEIDDDYRIATKDDNSFSSSDKDSMQNRNHQVSLGNGFECPSACVLILIDESKPAPNNFSAIIFDGSKKETYFWLLKDKNLSRSGLSFHSSTPFIEMLEDDGTTDVCDVLWNPAKKTYELSCDKVS